jgi:hypothetical protein
MPGRAKITKIALRHATTCARVRLPADAGWAWVDCDMDSSGCKRSWLELESIRSIRFD